MSEHDSGPGIGPAACTDVALVAMVRAGDDSALAALYDRYGRQVYALARRILADEQLSQDVVQEVFLTIWRDTARFDSQRGGFSSWLLAMAHHKSVDLVRREDSHRRRRVELDELNQQQSDDPEVSEQVWASMRGQRVRQALKKLPETQREALVLAYFGGYTQRDIAGLTDAPLGTVKTRMLAGVRRLQQFLNDPGEGQ